MKVNVVAVIGAGTMGAGIAQICAQRGWRTKIFDTSEKSLQTSLKSINSFWEKGILRGKTTREQLISWSENLETHTDMAKAVSNADIVIEAVPEILSLKKEIFSKLDNILPEKTILVTNTSSLSISEIANSTNRPDRVIGMHFFNPVPIMKLIEIVRHEKCSKETIKIAECVGLELNKKTILVHDYPGFATSRLGVILGNEAIKMLSEGVASASDIDTAMVLGYKHPIGPLELTDLVGLDVRRDILNNLANSFSDDSYLPHPLLEKLVENGNLGIKTNKGIYNWNNGVKQDRDDL
ncbi:MAG: 3-hydroxybutyryl-CoA dehydrogenase [Euryarchaeota archaeon]|nr:3-hydroxybutyryl-CoA dehydrogenase [Euryarchaeota archaeon]|tara:strand:+ start:3352 stop:4236 length:885 start_codon:yes stop_codon:yes gene_type:complete